MTGVESIHQCEALAGVLLPLETGQGHKIRSLQLLRQQWEHFALIIRLVLGKNGTVQRGMFSVLVVVLTLT